MDMTCAKCQTKLVAQPATKEPPARSRQVRAGTGNVSGIRHIAHVCPTCHKTRGMTAERDY